MRSKNAILKYNVSYPNFKKKFYLNNLIKNLHRKHIYYIVIINVFK